MSKANDVLSLVSSYMMVNQLHINLAKSYFMNFGCKNKSSKLNNNKIRLFLNNVEIKEAIYHRAPDSGGAPAELRRTPAELRRTPAELRRTPGRTPAEFGELREEK